MPKLGRRQSIKLGAAALVVGPSVVFSREAAAAPSKQPLLRAGFFKVEVKGIYVKIPNVEAVDLGSASPSIDYTKWVHDYLKVSLSKDAPKLSKSFKAAVEGGSKVSHKVSVSLYSKGTKSPAVTYHVLNAVPVSIDHKGEAQYLEWKVGSIETEAFQQKMQTVQQLQLTKKAFKAEVNGQVIAVQSLHKFYAGKKKAIVSTELNPDASAGKPWLAPRIIKLDGAGEKIVVATKKGGSTSADTVPVDSFSLNFEKITLQAARSRDQVVLETTLNAGTPPASALLGASQIKYGELHANKASPKLMNVAAATETADESKRDVYLHLSTTKLGAHVIMKYGGATTAANKSSGGSSGPYNFQIEGIKMSLQTIEFPKLQVGSKAPVTETLRFEVDDG